MLLSANGHIPTGQLTGVKFKRVQGNKNCLFLRCSSWTLINTVVLTRFVCFRTLLIGRDRLHARLGGRFLEYRVSVCTRVHARASL